MENMEYLEKAKEIVEWINSSENKLPPSKKSKNEEEKKLAKELKVIYKKIIKPYQKLKKEKDIIAFQEKYPDVNQIIQLIQKIEKKEYDNEINNDSLNEDINIHKIEIEKELEENVQDKKSDEFEYDKSKSNQLDLVNLIVKDIKIRNTIEEANKLKQKYESDK